MRTFRLLPVSSLCSGEGNGNPLQSSCLENTIGRGAWTGCSPWGRKESDVTKQVNTCTFIDHAVEKNPHTYLLRKIHSNGIAWSTLLKISKMNAIGNSLVIRWLGLSDFTPMALGLIPGLGTKILQVAWCGQKKKRVISYCFPEKMGWSPYPHCTSYCPAQDILSDPKHWQPSSLSGCENVMGWTILFFNTLNISVNYSFCLWASLQILTQSLHHSPGFLWGSWWYSAPLSFFPGQVSVELPELLWRQK